MPEPLSEGDHLGRFLEDRDALAALQDTPQGPVDIHEAIARSIKFNLDNRLAQMETAFALDQFGAAKLQMLPRLALNAGYTMRDNESASSSISYVKRTQTLEPSVSSDRDRLTGDLSFSWSLLDFGISYFQAKQQANRYLILMERRRRIMNNLVKEVIGAYYRLSSLEKVRPLVEEAVVAAEEALAAYRKLEESRTASVVDALEQQRAILSILGQLRQLSTDIALSRSRLAALMNIPSHVEFSIVPIANDDFAPPRLQADVAQLESIGVFLRPDLREEAYQSRIDKDEVKKEMIRMFPGVNLTTGYFGDSNSFLVNEFWTETGARMTMDIMGLPARYKQYKASKTQTEVSRIRRLAGTVAAMVQIDMSYYQYQQAVTHFSDSRELNRIDGRLLEASSAAAGARTIGRMEHIMKTVASVNSRIDLDRRTIDVLGAWANLYFSVGCDMIPGMTGEEDLAGLVCLVERGLANWLAGELPDLPDIPEFHGQRLAAVDAYGAVLPEPTFAVVPGIAPVEPAMSPTAAAVATVARTPDTPEQFGDAPPAASGDGVPPIAPRAFEDSRRGRLLVKLAQKP